MEIGTIVTTDETQVVNNDGTVAQQMDARIVVELLGTLFAAIEFVITQAGIDGSRQTTELLSFMGCDKCLLVVSINS